MKVFVVMGGFGYDGDYKGRSIRVFNTKESADNYIHTLTAVGIYNDYSKEIDKYDWGSVFEQEVED